MIPWDRRITDRRAILGYFSIVQHTNARVQRAIKKPDSYFTGGNYSIEEKDNVKARLLQMVLMSNG